MIQPKDSRRGTPKNTQLVKTLQQQTSTAWRK
ncbi:hypothetical protein Cal6303_1054 [Calothrix sp. PCC 6303]|nr:hypothetical protein Cal6303_1054 [Calothrix sp. PCC 6303]